MMTRILYLFLFFVLTNTVQAQKSDSITWVIDGNVKTIAKGGNLVYLGGNFKTLGQFTGGGAMLNSENGKLVNNKSLKIKGWVSAAVADGHDGWYIGGPFTEINGETCNGLAHIFSDNSLDVNWKVNLVLRENGYVTKMLLNENILYISGHLISVNKQVRNNVAAIDVQNQQLLSWDPKFNGNVKCMTILNNSLYIGGLYTATINGQTYKNLTRFDALTGLPISWQIDFSETIGSSAITAGEILDMDSYKNSLYVLGTFSTLDRSAKIIAINTTTNITSNQTPQTGDLYNIKIVGNKLFLGGWFSQVNGQSRENLAAIDLETQQLLPWSPANVPIITRNSFSVSGNTVYIGSGYVDAVKNNQITAVDINTGTRKTWDSVIDGESYCLIASDKSLFVGGPFNSAGGSTRKSLASIDLTTNSITNWNPTMENSEVNKLLINKGLVYVAGYFSRINNQERNGLGSLDAITGYLTNWNPNIKMNYSGGGSGPGIVNDIAIENDILYAGGFFSTVGQVNRKNIAAINTLNGQATLWNPEANGTGISNIILFKDQVYIGGDFTQVNSQTRKGLASILKANGTLTSWNPNLESGSTNYPTTGGRVNAMTLANNSLYIAGSYNQIFSKSRIGLSSIDLVSGELTNWSPTIQSEPRKIAIINNTCYSIGSSIIDANVYINSVFSSKATKWNLKPLPSIWTDTTSILEDQGCIYLQGTIAKAYDIYSATQFNVFAFQLTNNNSHKTLNRIEGTVFNDKNGDCQQNSEEPSLSNVVVTVEPGPYYSISDQNGKYSIEVDTGTYFIKQRLDATNNKQFIIQVCPSTAKIPQVSFKTYGNTSQNNSFGNQVTYKPHLTINVTSNRRRRCFTNQTSIDYCNSGSAEAKDAKIYLQLPDNIVLVSTSIPYSRDSQKNYIFSVGNLLENQCGSIRIIDSVICNNPGIRGLTACTKVWITPSNNYTLAPDSPWDQSDMSLSGKCIENGRVRLVIHNTGKAMADSSAFRIYLDVKLAMQKHFRLTAGDSLVLRVPANGKTVRLEADQRQGHPRKSQSNLTIEGCVATTSDVVSKGFVDVLPQDDPEPEVAISCLPIIDSYDPNDKLVSPIGTKTDHYTPTNSELKYTIRFQNTGTDTAYTVVVVDTLSDNLDISTLQLGAASHKYSFNLSGKVRPVLTWTFANINLPDSTRDQAGSNGFVQFSIKPKAGLAEKARIDNFADIFFDYNEPVRTNTTTNVMYDLPPIVDNAVRLNEKGVVFLKPTIQSFTPVQAGFGEQMTIKGSNYQTVAADNIVKINGMRATVVSASETELVVIVPQAVTMGKVSVTTLGGTAVSEVDFVLSSEQPQWSRAIRVYPNPSQGRFTVDLSGSVTRIDRIEVVNSLGQKIVSQNVSKASSKQEIDLSGHNSGFYLVVFHSQAGNATRKIIIR